jgi:hypothetical protein
MTLEVLHIDDCPNWQDAGARASHALAALGRPDVIVEYRLVRTSADATLAGFAGSPTLTLDGEDIFPSGGRTADLACRIYLTPHGFAGVPTQDQVTEALAAKL